MNVLKRDNGVDYQGPVNDADLADDIKIGSLSADSPAPAFWNTSILSVINWLLLYFNTGLTEKLSDITIESSDGTVGVTRDDTNPVAPAFDLSAAGGPAVALPLSVLELYGTPFVIAGNASSYTRRGAQVSLMIDVAFDWPDGDNLGKIVGLPYVRTGPEFAASGIVVTPEETAPGSGYYTTHAVVVRPDVDDESALRVYWPDGVFYHPSEMYAGEYRLIVELWYYTGGEPVELVYLQDFTSGEVYSQDFESEEVYFSTL